LQKGEPARLVSQAVEKESVDPQPKRTDYNQVVGNGRRAGKSEKLWIGLKSPFWGILWAEVQSFLSLSGEPHTRGVGKKGKSGMF